MMSMSEMVCAEVMGLSCLISEEVVSPIDVL